MAGETTTQAKAGATIPRYMPNGGQVAVAREKFEITAGELELNDIIQVLTLPKGAIVTGGYLSTDDLDSNCCPLLTLSVGNGDDPDGYLATNTVGQAGGVARFDGVLMRDGVTSTADDTVDIKVVAAAATAAGGTVTLVVEYIRGADDL